MRHKNYSLSLTISLFFLMLIISFTFFQISKSRSFQFFGGLTERVITDKKVIALTFDDAPSEFSDKVLTTLKQKNVKATFYVLGNEMERLPEMGKHIVREGHELGNHSYSHERFLLKSQSFIDNEVQTTNTLIRNVGYTKEITFRPPYGKKLFGLPWYLKQKNIKTIMWDVEPDRYVDEKATDKTKTDFIVRYTIENTKPGSIILLHPFCKSCESDRKAIPQIINVLQKKGYTFITVSELLTHEKN